MPEYDGELAGDMTLIADCGCAIKVFALIGPLISTHAATAYIVNQRISSPQELIRGHKSKSQRAF